MRVPKLELAAISLIVAGVFCSRLHNTLKFDGVRVYIDTSNNLLLWLIGCIVAVLILGGIFTSLQPKSYTIDNQLRNTIIAYSPSKGCYLVEAHSKWNIQGSRPHTIGNLPANIWDYGNGLYVVDPRHVFDTSNGPNSVERWKNKADWKYVPPVFEIFPRGEASNNDALGDIMDGFTHNYIHRKGDSIPDAHPNMTKVDTDRRRR